MEPERVQLHNAVFEGENAVYLLDGSKTVLVDTGVDSSAVRAELTSWLDDRGLSFADIDEVFLTHWHLDHAGLAHRIQDAGGATVRIHEADAPLVANEPEAGGSRTLQDRRFREWGIPDEKRSELERYLESTFELGGGPADVTTFVDGATFDLGGGTLEAVHLPGHAAGLSAFAFDGARGREAFVGDAILPEYTPNVGGADLRVDRPLATYADSLARLVDLDFARAWPGHREPIADPAGRAAEILAHHRERTRRVVDVLGADGPCDAWTVSARLFGDLEGIHILHGPGEAYAHLDHLEATGVVKRDGRAYALREAPSSFDPASLFPPLPETSADTKH